MLPQNNKVAKNFLVSTSCIFFIFCCLKLASGFFIPFFFSVFIALLIFPITDWLIEHKVPKILSIIISLLLVFASLTSIFLLSFFLLKDFALSWNEKYRFILEGRLLLFLDYINQVLRSFGIEEKQGLELLKYLLEQVKFLQEFNLSYLWNFGAGVAGGIFDVLTFTLLVFVITIFLVIELTTYKKSSLLQKEILDSIWNRLILRSLNEIRKFLGIKTIVSIITGLLIGLICRFFSLDFYVLWGLLAFLLNYIPVFGSLIAILFPVCFSLILQDFSSALWISIFSLSTNLIIGNFVEPLVLGNTLKLSKLVVIVSVIFWGWLWGAFGMFFAVPFLIFIRIIANQNSQLQWLTYFLQEPRQRL